MTDDVFKNVDEFFSKYREKNYSKGQVLILNGDETNYVYYLISGKVKEYDVSYHGDELILNVFKPPAFFPMSLALNKNENPYIFEAETDIIIRQAPANEVVDFLKANPDVTFDLLSRVYKGADVLLGRIVQLMANNAKNRLIYELVIEAHRFGQVQSDNSYRLAINEKALGARAGLSRETVSREIQKLKAEQFIEVNNKHIIIKDLSALEEKLDN